MVSLNAFKQKITQFISENRRESISCLTDRIPINRALDYLTEDIANFLEANKYPFIRTQFLLDCGFQSW